jgi:hypothetical protein
MEQSLSLFSLALEHTQPGETLPPLRRVAAGASKPRLKFHLQNLFGRSRMHHFLTSVIFLDSCDKTSARN